MGVEGISKSQVSRMCTELDQVVESWRTRPLDAGPYPFLWIDALVLKVREGGCVVNTSALVATALNASGHREIVGLQLGSAETGSSWTAFLRDLVARGLHGVQLVTSDAHGGLKDAIAAVLDGATGRRAGHVHHLAGRDPDGPAHMRHRMKMRMKGYTRRHVARLELRLRDVPPLVSNPQLQQRYGGTVIPHLRIDAGPGIEHIAGPLQVGFLGTPRPQKGVDVLRRAVRSLRDDGIDITLTLTASPPRDAGPGETWLGDVGFERRDRFCPSSTLWRCRRATT